MNRALILSFALLVAIVAAGVGYKLFKPVYPPRMSVSELADRLDDPGLIVLDVRRDPDFEQSDATIPGAKRVPPKSFRTAVAGLDKTKEYTLFCA